MRYLKITLIFVLVCCLVFIAANMLVVEIAGWFGVVDWLGDFDNDTRTLQFNSTATLALIIFAIGCAFCTAKRCLREARKEDDGEGTAK